MARRRIGLLGGTFDPIHVGHLALARAAQVALPLDALHFIPTGQSWQKAASSADGSHRLAMVRLAIAGTPGWQVDSCELDRPGPSYTVDTLQALRRALGPEPALVLLLGADQLHNLASWRRYRDLLQYAHIAVTGRGPHRLADFEPAIEALLAEHGREALPDRPSGAIVFFRMPAVPVSSTVLRQALARGERPSELLPPPVLDYIREHHLYQDRPASGQPA